MTNIQAILLMTVSMAFFALEDFFVKLVSTSITPVDIFLFIGLFGCLCFAYLAHRQNIPLTGMFLKNRAFQIRYISDQGLTIFFIIAIFQTDLTLISAIIQATPIAMAFAGWFFFGQPIGRPRMIAIVVGFCGVLLIINPTPNSFNPWTILGLLCVLCMVARDSAMRKIQTEIHPLVISFYGFFTAIIAGIVFIPVWGLPTGFNKFEIICMFAALFAGLIGYYTIVLATRAGNIATVSAFRYSRLVFALFLGVIFLGERPHNHMIIGAVIVVASGLFILWRETRSQTHPIS